MLMGTHDGIIHHAQRLDIHGTYFYDLVVAHAATPDQLRRVRVGSEAIYADPRPDDAVRITYLMGVPTAIERRNREGAELP